MRKALDALEITRTVLLVDNSANNRNLELSSRNLEGVKLVASRDVNVYDLLGHQQVLLSEAAARKLSEALGIMANLYDVIKRPLVTEKGVTKKDAERTLCFEVAVERQQDPDPARGRSRFQSESGGSAHVHHGGQAAAARTFCGLSLGLEKSLRASEGRREDAGVRGDLSHAG